MRLESCCVYPRFIPNDEGGSNAFAGITLIFAGFTNASFTNASFFEGDAPIRKTYTKQGLTNAFNASPS